MAKFTPEELQRLAIVRTTICDIERLQEQLSQAMQLLESNTEALVGSSEGDSEEIADLVDCSISLVASSDAFNISFTTMLEKVKQVMKRPLLTIVK